MRTLRVQPIDGELFRYKVVSEGEDEHYLVDMTENDGHGLCNCADYDFRVQSNLNRRVSQLLRDAKEEGSPISEKKASILAHIPWAEKREGRTECKHIAVVRQHVWKYRMIPFLRALKAGVPSDLQNELQNLVRP